MTEHTPQFVQPQLPFDEIPYGYCRCGCGQKTRIAHQSSTQLGWIKGEPIKYILGHCKPQVQKRDAWQISSDKAPWVARHGLFAPYGKCQCGCGNDAAIAQQSNSAKGLLISHPRRFAYGHGRSQPLAAQFWENVHRKTDNECWPWEGNRSGGRYGRLRNHGQQLAAHRTSYEIHFGTIPEGMFVCHTCDNPICVNPRHLFLGTPNDNMQDKITKGRERYLRGDENPASRLTTTEVIAIRERARSGETQSALARQYGISQSTISEIVLYKIWRSVP